jgi:hypothetical protein
MPKSRNTKGDDFPPIRPRSIWVEFTVGFCSGVASSFFVNKADVLALLASIYVAPCLVCVWHTLTALLEWIRPPPSSISVGGHDGPGSTPIRALISVKTPVFRGFCLCGALGKALDSPGHGANRVSDPIDARAAFAVL